MKLKIGDRVSVRWVQIRPVNTISGTGSEYYVERSIARISRINGDLVSLNGLSYEGACIGPMDVFSGQCRKLKPKEKTVRITESFFITAYAATHPYDTYGERKRCLALAKELGL